MSKTPQLTHFMHLLGRLRELAGKAPVSSRYLEPYALDEVVESASPGAAGRTSSAHKVGKLQTFVVFRPK